MIQMLGAQFSSIRLAAGMQIGLTTHMRALKFEAKKNLCFREKNSKEDSEGFGRQSNDYQNW